MSSIQTSIPNFSKSKKANNLFFWSNDTMSSYCMRNTCYIEIWFTVSVSIKINLFQIITALNKSWHPDHFVCLKCDKPISGSTFNERDGSPICSDCFLQYFSEICASCKKPIKGVSVKTNVSNSKTVKNYDASIPRCDGNFLFQLFLVRHTSLITTLFFFNSSTSTKKRQTNRVVFEQKQKFIKIF